MRIPVSAAGNAETEEKAAALAEKLSAPLIRDLSELPEEELVLCFEDEGLSLRSGGLTVRADFSKLLPRVRNGMWRKEALIKAAKIKNPAAAHLAVDMTAGFGEDAFLLAAGGSRVLLFEKDPVIAALLRDAIERAAGDAALREITGRMILTEEDSIEGIRSLTESPDIVYLDPMFPERKKSALIKKKFQLLQKLERPEMNEEALLQAALSLKPAKVIIKRPAKGPYLSGRKPDYTIPGASVRFDCILGGKHESID